MAHSRSASELIWSQEFGGLAGSAPDPSIWVAELGAGGWGCGQLQWYTDARANALVTADSCLAIVARREGDTDRPAGVPPGAITSARLITRDRFTVAYGRIAARIRVPPGLGLWPAFWMLGDDIGQVGWPRCGEIDIMEYVGGQPTTVHGTLHGPGYAGLIDGVGHAHDASVDLSADFHVYAVDWTPDNITWSIDDIVYSRLTPGHVPGPWPFTHPFYLLINLAVGGDWPGNHTDDPALPAVMLVDWVRVYAPR